MSTERLSSRRKSVGKSISRGLTPFQKGPDPRRGNGPPNGSGGRPPAMFRDFIAELRSDPNVQEELRRTLLDRNSKHYAAALRVLVDYDDELPVSTMSTEQRKARILEIVREAAQRQKAAAG